MSDPHLVVLKAGGSVLRSAVDYERIARLIHTHVAAGRKVVAVASARHGRTERLLAQASAFVRHGDVGVVARHVALGEHASAARLELTCVRAGLDVSGLDAQALGIEASAVDDAVAWSADQARRLRDELARHDVVVVPGFLARDRTTGSLTTLGRGGSDLTAFVVASTLRDRGDLASVFVELIKDVDGLFEVDPRRDRSEAVKKSPASGGTSENGEREEDGRGDSMERVGEAIRRSDRRSQPFRRRREFFHGLSARAFDVAQYDDVARYGGGVVQHRALEWARAAGLRFTLRAPTSNGGTVVGDVASSPVRARPSREPMRVALIGCGVVGERVLRTLAREPDRFTLGAVLVRTRYKPRAPDLPCDALLVDGDAWLAHAADVVVDVATGTEPVARLAAALRAGRHVVTANKALAARHGPELAALAARHGVTFATSACVGGAAPMLEAIGRARGDLVAFEGVVNATSSVVLDALARGESLAEAIDGARRCGFAEADASRDLEGIDAAEKLVLLLRAAGLPEPTVDAIPREPIDESTTLRARAAACEGSRLRQIVSWSSAGPRVRLAAVGPRHALASCVDARVALAIDRGDGPRVVARGLGAGAHATTTAILTDLAAIEARADRARDPPG